MCPLQVQCFDSTGTRLEFHPSESFGFLPVPEFLMEDAVRKIEVCRADIIRAYGLTFLRYSIIFEQARRTKKNVPRRQQCWLEISPGTMCPFPSSS